MANLVLGATNSANAPTTLKSSGKSQFNGQLAVIASAGGTALRGSALGSSNTGVVGEAFGNASNGVFGQATTIGVFGLSVTNPGDLPGFGVYGEGATGVLGKGDTIGIEGRSDDGIAIQGNGNWAGAFYGKTFISGPLYVTGTKSAVVAHPDGSHRALYCVESPESWFEDFGRARLSKGRAKVMLDSDFAALVSRDDYHVFLTPEGDCDTVYVHERTRAGFEVRERGTGRSSVEFSYRVVARRKDARGPRLAKVTLPKVSKPVPAPSRPRSGQRKKTRSA